MPGNKELLEAAAFHRRRLVAAFLRGAVDDDPPRVQRPVVVGLLVAVLAVAAVVAPAGSEQGQSSVQTIGGSGWSWVQVRLLCDLTTLQRSTYLR